jgi:exodeoxyribonuclease VII small subunit
LTPVYSRNCPQGRVGRGRQYSLRRPTLSPMAERLSYEDARAQLVEVVQRLEAGGTTLEDALALWERGEQLAAVCQEWLDGARKRLEAAQNGAD